MNKRELFPVRRRASDRFDAVSVRKTICERLKLLSQKVGSVSVLSEEIGVNRTQLSRYLSGQSVPRPELLVRIAQTYDLPLGWLMTPHEDAGASLSEFALADSMYDLYANRRFQVPGTTLSDGFYLAWKGLFTDPGKVEAYLCRIQVSNGVGRVRSNMINYLKRSGDFEQAEPIDHICSGIALKSHRGISISYSDSSSNIMASCFLLPATSLRYSTKEVFAGFMTLHCATGRKEVNIVPKVIEKLPSDCSSLLGAARKTGVYAYDELPPKIREQISDLEVPEYGVR